MDLDAKLEEAKVLIMKSKQYAAASSTRDKLLAKGGDNTNSGANQVDQELVMEIDEEVKALRTEVNDLITQVEHLRRGGSRSQSPDRSQRGEDDGRRSRTPSTNELKKLEEKCSKVFDE